MRLLADIGESWYLANPLAGLASLAAQQNRPSTAAHLLGAASDIHEKSGSAVFPIEQERNSQTLATVRLALGEEATEQAIAEGRRLPIAAVVALAEGGARI